VAGHPGRLGDKQDVIQAKEYFLDLLKEASENLGDMTAYFKYLGNDYNRWNMVRSWWDDGACSCAKKLIEKWGGKIAAVDVYADTHCLLVQQQIRLANNPYNLNYVQAQVKKNSLGFLNA
jgi:hypothetical protein